MKRALKLAISAGYVAVVTLRRMVRRLIGLPLPPRLMILCYHAVPAAKTAGFARQLASLGRAGPIVPCDADPALLTHSATAITFDDAFESVADNALPLLREASAPCAIFVPSGVLGRQPAWKFDGDSADQRETIMTEARLQGLDSSRVLLGSHTLTHPRLPECGDADLTRELADSRTTLSQALRRGIETLAFPYGAHDERVVSAARAAGYAVMFSITPTPVSLGAGPVRGRVTVEPDDPPLEFFLKSRGGYAWMAWASRCKAALRPRAQSRAFSHAPAERPSSTIVPSHP